MRIEIEYRKNRMESDRRMEEIIEEIRRQHDEGEGEVLTSHLPFDTRSLRLIGWL